jgi:hypothetical protein
VYSGGTPENMDVVAQMATTRGHTWREAMAALIPEREQQEEMYWATSIWAVRASSSHE